MTNSLALLLCALVVAKPAHSFSPAASISSASATPTALHSMIFEPPPADNCELDGSDCEESVFDRKRRERNQADDAIVERYRNEHGVELRAVDLMESIDQYQNAPTGGNIMAGISLSALCEDD